MVVAVVHCDSNGLIGTSGTRAYKSREDHQWFKSFTRGKHLVMGRNTYAECGDLANRGILCLSSSGNLYNGRQTKHNVESLGKYNVVICGGAKVYEQYLPICDQVIVNYTKQAKKQPGLSPTYFNLKQLNELFTEVERVEYKTFTQVIYKPRTKSMQYYVVSGLLHGINRKHLTASYDFKGNLAYYTDPNAGECDKEYYKVLQVFKDYDDALAYFCDTAAAKLAYYKAQIALIEKVKNEVLELGLG